MKNLIAVLVFIFAAQTAIADAKDFYFGGHDSKQQEHQSHSLQFLSIPDFFGKDSRKKLVFSQKLDHFDETDSRVFSQRFYENSEFATDKNSAVLLYICGESECRSSALSGQVRSYASKLKARMVALEHRYYGKSQPFSSLTTSNLKYLSTPQALADLDSFQKWYTKRDNLKGSWIAIGGSYAGNLAAYYRSEYPNNVVGALASSAPVRAHESFKEYDEHVSKAAGAVCVANMLEVSEYIESNLNDPAVLPAIKAKFDATVVKNERDFLYLVTDVGSAAVQYGMKTEFCNSIAGSNKLDGYAKFAKTLFTRFGMMPVEMTFQVAESTAIPASGAFGMRAWLYQSCTEYGYWQIASDDEANRSRSLKIDLAYHQETCKRLFGIATPAPVDQFNDDHHLPLTDGRSGKIFFTNGSDDPWSNLSILTTHTPDIDTFMISGAAHCDDLRGSSSTDSASLKDSRKRFVDLALDWL